MKTRFALGLAVAIAVVSLSVAFTSAQYGGRVPSGTYSRSCSKATMIGGVLTAECKDQNGIAIDTRLYIRDCVGDISNVLGELVCGSRRPPQGSYSQTCNACTTNGSSLQCSCRDTKQNSIKTALDLASCDFGGRITNKDGHLQCD
jgi:CVNH domain